MVDNFLIKIHIQFIPKWFERISLLKQKVSFGFNLKATPGYPRFPVSGMIEWGQKSKPIKIARASNKTKKNPWTKN